MKILLLILILLIPKFIKAEDITKEVTYLLNDQLISNNIKDNKESTYISIKANDCITIKSKEEINSLYIVYERKSSQGILNYNEKEIIIGSNNFLHEYIALDELTKEIKITYKEDVKIADIYTISPGDIPSYVEIWKPPVNEADLLLFSTHADDEQLFFLGLLPTYVAKGASIEVVYFTNHYDNTKRLHEQLHGLYEVGIRNYPIIGIIPDAYSESLEEALKNLEKAGLSENDALKFSVEMLRRFKPLVVVSHDELGEYGHGQHILNTYILKEALKVVNDGSFDKESFNLYGGWDPKKVYLHLYKERPMVMDYDTPLPYFDNQTAYEVSKKGYSKHLSQQWTWFTGWINGKNNEYTKATDIKTYSPNEFGLYYTTVGDDILKNDMFENLTLRKDIKEEKPKEKEEKKEEEPFHKNNDNVYLYLLIIILITIIIIIFIIFIIKRLRKRKK